MSESKRRKRVPNRTCRAPGSRSGHRQRHATSSPLWVHPIHASDRQVYEGSCNQLVFLIRQSKGRRECRAGDKTALSLTFGQNERWCSCKHVLRGLPSADPLLLQLLHLLQRCTLSQWRANPAAARSNLEQRVATPSVNHLDNLSTQKGWRFLQTTYPAYCSYKYLSIQSF